MKVQVYTYMKKNLAKVSLASLVGFTCLLVAGCGSEDASYVAPNSTVLREYAIIPNTNAGIGNGSITVKNVNLQNGTSSVVNQNFTEGVENDPLIVRTHPNINVVYVLNNNPLTPNGTVSQYTIDANGGLAYKGSVTTPPNPTILAVHPSGGYVYVVGQPAAPIIGFPEGPLADLSILPGTIRRFKVNNDGLLSDGVDKSTTNNYNPTAPTFIKDGDFSFGGGTFHVPCLGAIESYPVNNDGTLGNAVLATVPNTDNITDIDVRPGQASLVAVVRSSVGNGYLRSYSVNNGVLSTPLTTLPGEQTLGFGDMATNGQYYVGSVSNPRMFGYNVDNTTGALTPLSTNPMQVANGNSVYSALDPSNNFILSVSNSAGTNLLVARFRGQNGEFVGSTSDSQGLVTPGAFDFFVSNF